MLRIYWLGVCLALNASAMANEPTAWLTGAAFERQLEQAAGGAWSAIPFRAAVDQLAQTNQIAVLIDRRIDPDRAIELSTSEISLSELFEQLAARRDCRVIRVDAVLYFAPERAARLIRTLVELRNAEVRQLDRTWQQWLLARKPLVWEMLATPRDLVAELAAEAKLEVEGLEQIPHDLWAAANLPPLVWTQRVQLVLSQFDLTFRIDPDTGRLEIVPIPTEVYIERRYPASSSPRTARDRIAAAVPDAHVELDGKSVVVRGSLEDHERIAATPRRSAPSKPVAEASDASLQRFTLRVENVPLGKLIATLNRQQATPIELSEATLTAAGLSAETLVSLDVNQVTLQELVEAAVGRLELKVQQRDGKLVIVAGNASDRSEPSPP